MTDPHPDIPGIYTITVTGTHPDETPTVTIHLPAGNITRQFATIDAAHTHAQELTDLMRRNTTTNTQPR